MAAFEVFTEVSKRFEQISTRLAQQERARCVEQVEQVTCSPI